MSDSPISAVVVTYNSEDAIGECLEALRRHSIPGVVIDNGSEDKTCDVVRASGFPLVVNARNEGFSGGVNRGASMTESPYILILNPDTVLAADPRNLLADFEDPQVGAAAGPLIGDDGTYQKGFSVRRLPTFLTLAFEVLGVNRLLPWNPVNRRWRCADVDFTRPCDVEQPAGAFFMVRRSVWRQLGGFDPTFQPVWFEDVDFCFRLRERRLRVRFQPTAVAKHTGAHSIRKIPVEIRLLYWYGSLLRYASKHYRVAATRVLSLAVISGAFARLVPEFVIHPGAMKVKIYGRIVRLAGKHLIGSRQSGEESVLTG